MHRIGIGGFALLLALATGGCAFMQSSSTSSDSSGSSSDSSSDSSGSSSGGNDNAYREDVRALTIAHITASRRPEALALGLTELALGRGISDWEALPGTFSAIGAGLAQAGSSDERVAAFQRVLTRPGSAGFEAIREGYAAAKP